MPTDTRCFQAFPGKILMLLLCVSNSSSNVGYIGHAQGLLMKSLLKMIGVHCS